VREKNEGRQIASLVSGTAVQRMLLAWQNLFTNRDDGTLRNVSIGVVRHHSDAKDIQ